MTKNLLLNSIQIVRVLAVLAFIFLGFGCAQSQITMFSKKSESGASTKVKYPPEAQNLVGIYRSQIPFEKYDEIGFITLRTNAFSLPWIYNQIRTDAAQKGAQAVVGLKIKGETHAEWFEVQKCEQQTDCDVNGICSTHEVCHFEQELRNVSSFLSEASMIRRKE